MIGELQEKLHRQFPEFFRRTDMSLQDSCMPYDIECGEGWYGIILRGCLKLQRLIAKKKELYPDKTFTVEFEQIKEKYGTLRWYYTAQTDSSYDKSFYDAVDEIINEAEAESFYTCEQCGSERAWVAFDSWLRTECSVCKGYTPYADTADAIKRYRDGLIEGIKGLTLEQKEEIKNFWGHVI